MNFLSVEMNYEVSGALKLGLKQLCVMCSNNVNVIQHAYKLSAHLLQLTWLK